MQPADLIINKQQDGVRISFVYANNHFTSELTNKQLTDLIIHLTTGQGDMHFPPRKITGGTVSPETLVAKKDEVPKILDMEAE